MKRFKILCVLLLTVFFASVVTDFVLDFIAGAKMGYNMVEYTIANGLESREHLYVDVVADGEGKALAPNAVNKLSGDSVVILRNNVSIVEYAKSFAEETDKHNVWYEILCWLNWVIIAIFVYLIFFIGCTQTPYAFLKYTLKLYPSEGIGLEKLPLCFSSSVSSSYFARLAQPTPAIRKSM